MNLPLFSPGQKFKYQGTIYRITQVTEDALECASIVGQSIWISQADLRQQLGLIGRIAAFKWQEEVSVD